MSGSKIKTDTGPFAMLPEWLLEAEVSDRAVRLYGILARHADKDTGEAIPSRARLAEKLRCSRDSIDRATKELETVGALGVEARFDEAGDRTSNLYTVFRVRQGGREAAATGTSTDAATGGREAAAQNESQFQRESIEREDLAPLAAAVEIIEHQRKRDLLFEAVCEATGTNPSELTKPARGALNTALKNLREVGAIPEEVARRARSYHQRYPDIELTPSALASHWPRLGRPKPAKSDAIQSLYAKEQHAQRPGVHGVLPAGEPLPEPGRRSG